MAGMSSPDKRCWALFFQAEDLLCLWSVLLPSGYSILEEEGGDFPCLSFKRERSHRPNFMQLVLLVPINLFMTFGRFAQGNARLEITAGFRQSPSPDNATSGSFQRCRHREMPESSLVALKEFKYL